MFAIVPKENVGNDTLIVGPFASRDDAKTFLEKHTFEFGIPENSYFILYFTSPSAFDKGE